MITSWICRGCNAGLLVYTEMFPGELSPQWEHVLRERTAEGGGRLVDLRHDLPQCPQCGTTRGFDPDTAGEQGLSFPVEVIYKEHDCGQLLALFVPAMSGPTEHSLPAAQRSADANGAVLIDPRAPELPRCPGCGLQFRMAGGEGAETRERISE